MTGPKPPARRGARSSRVKAASATTGRSGGTDAPPDTSADPHSLPTGEALEGSPAAEPAAAAEPRVPPPLRDIAFESGESCAGPTKWAADVRTVNLALQGGGAHGAFAWGVLDRLLEDGRVKFDGVSATSAGSMNAIVLAYGLTVGGRDGARKALHDFWHNVSEASMFSPLQPSLIDRFLHNRSLEFSPNFVFFDLMSRILSPYQFNPLNINPLRDVLTSSVDFETIRKSCAVRLFLSATNVRSGKVRIFTHEEMTADAVLATACLPFLFQTVEIDGEAYWDGGYMGNPAIFPLIYGSATNDVLIVHINPLYRDEVPKNAHDIMNRINEISFNSSLMREMRAIAFVTKLIDDGQLTGTHKRMLVHSIRNDEFMTSLSVTSKLNPDWEFLQELRDAGRVTAERWLSDHFQDIGVCSSSDIRSLFL